MYSRAHGWIPFEIFSLMIVLRSLNETENVWQRALAFDTWIPEANVARSYSSDLA